MIVTPLEVKTICPEININISDTLISNGIELVTNTLIKDSIGQEWLEEIEYQISGNTLTTQNKYIVDNFLKYICSFGVQLHLVITLSLQLNDSGLRIKVSDHSTAAESSDLSFYRSYIQDFIDNKRESMYRYIKYHPTDYPKYYSDFYNDKPIENRFNFKMSKVQKKYDNDSTCFDGPDNTSVP